MTNKKIVILNLCFLLITPLFLQAQENKKSDTKLKADLANSKVTWIGKKPGGQHTGNVNLSSGEVLINNNEIKGGNFTLDLNSITNTDLEDKEYNKKLVDHLKSPDFFDVQKFPTATFSITKVTKLNVKPDEGTPKATHHIEGNLTMKGVTKKIEFDASLNMLKGKLTASSLPFSIDRTMWGVNYQSKSIVAGLKDQFIFDEISLGIDLVTN